VTLVFSGAYIVRFTVRANKDKEALGDGESFENFHPTFTYPVCRNPSSHSLLRRPADFRAFQIYGEDENIYGYSDLVIDVRAASLSEGT
jgi:histone acetyltransferase 1